MRKNVHHIAPPDHPFPWLFFVASSFPALPISFAPSSSSKLGDLLRRGGEARSRETRILERVNAGEHQVQETRGAPDVKPVQAKRAATAAEPRRVEH